MRGATNHSKTNNLCVEVIYVYLVCHPSPKTDLCVEVIYGYFVYHPIQKTYERLCYSFAWMVLHMQHLKSRNKKINKGNHQKNVTFLTHLATSTLYIINYDTSTLNIIHTD
jgi:hypothetical protein